jgi:hypothetical protein
MVVSDPSEQSDAICEGCCRRKAARKWIVWLVLMARVCCGQALVAEIRRPEPLDPLVQGVLVRLFLNDPVCSGFMEHWGAMFPLADGLVPEVEGAFARLPPKGASKFYVALVNHFGASGGFTALLDRIVSEFPHALLFVILSVNPPLCCRREVSLC